MDGRSRSWENFDPPLQLFNTFLINCDLVIEEPPVPIECPQFTFLQISVIQLAKRADLECADNFAYDFTQVANCACMVVN